MKSWCFWPQDFMLLQSLCDLTWPSLIHSLFTDGQFILPPVDMVHLPRMSAFPTVNSFSGVKGVSHAIFWEDSADFVDCWRIQKYTSALRMVVHIELAPCPEGFFERMNGWTLLLFSFFPFKNCVLTYKDTRKSNVKWLVGYPFWLWEPFIWHILISVWKGNSIGATECAHGRGQWRTSR